MIASVVGTLLEIPVLGSDCLASNVLGLRHFDLTEAANEVLVDLRLDVVEPDEHAIAALGGRIGEVEDLV